MYAKDREQTAFFCHGIIGLPFTRLARSLAPFSTHSHKTPCDLLLLTVDTLKRRPLLMTPSLPMEKSPLMILILANRSLRLPRDVPWSNSWWKVVVTVSSFTIVAAFACCCCLFQEYVYTFFTNHTVPLALPNALQQKDGQGRLCRALNERHGLFGCSSFFSHLFDNLLSIYSFRDSEVNWDYVRILPDGECVSVDGTHLGHNLPDSSGNRYCINLVSVAGQSAAQN